MDRPGDALPLLPCRDCGRLTAHGLFKKPTDPSLGSVCCRCGRVNQPTHEVPPVVSPRQAPRATVK